MKLLVFAHTPPPHHGQSYMVELMLNGLGGDQRGSVHATADRPEIACHHVNARLSDGMADIGQPRGGKLLLLLRYCLEAIWCRFRYGITTFYHIPAPGRRAPLYRDWVILLLCRPFFRRWIMHWHAVGLGEWVEKKATLPERLITRWLFSKASLGISLTETNRRDAEVFHPRQIAVVPNGIPDPCPDFSERLAPLRTARAQERRRHLAEKDSSTPPFIYRVLFMAHCTREKGIFDTLEAVALVNQENKGLRIELTLAGNFTSATEEQAVRERMAQPDLRQCVRHVGFAGPAEKKELLEASDCFCFPSYYHAESFGLVLVEAMAFGLATITTHLRAFPELLPDGYPGLVPPHSPHEIKECFYQLADTDLSHRLRQTFVQRFSLPQHLNRLRCALLETERPL